MLHYTETCFWWLSAYIVGYTPAFQTSSDKLGLQRYVNIYGRFDIDGHIRPDLP